MQRPLVIAVVVTALGLGACPRGARDEPPCGAVGAKFLVLARADLASATTGATPGATVDPKIDAALGRAVLDQLPAMRDSIVHACIESKWSREVRTCLVDAADHVAFEACEQQLTDAQRSDLERTAREPDQGAHRGAR